jgi:NAD(P)-dependent dehydrogenase (short-subunit alcohol dehydrogenase family)
MNDFPGRVAVVTGAASGIGLGIARALAVRGVSLAIADIDFASLQRAAADLSATGVSVLPIPVDVSNRRDMYAAAVAVSEAFGRLDILVNNAGVAYNAKPLHETPDEMIDWNIAVNLVGVLNGIKAFVPRIIASGRGGHVVNTSSIGGFQVRKSDKWHQGLYAATKYAVTALSEGLRLDLEHVGIGVSILAPSHVLTEIGSSDRNRPARFGGPTTGAQSPLVEQMLRASGMAPDQVGERVVQAIIDNELYVFTHMEGLPLVEARHRCIESAYEATRTYIENTRAAAQQSHLESNSIATQHAREGGEIS